MIRMGRVLRDVLVHSTNRDATPENIAALLGRSVQWLYQTADVRGLLERDHYNHFSAESAGWLAMQTGDTRLLEWMIEQCGVVCTRVPESRDAVIAGVRGAAEVLSRTAKLVESIAAAAADGRVEEDEREAIKADALAAMRSLAGVLAWCEHNEQTS